MFWQKKIANGIELPANYGRADCFNFVVKWTRAVNNLYKHDKVRWMLSHIDSDRELYVLGFVTATVEGMAQSSIQEGQPQLLDLFQELNYMVGCIEKGAKLKGRERLHLMSEEFGQILAKTGICLNGQLSPEITEYVKANDSFRVSGKEDIEI